MREWFNSSCKCLFNRKIQTDTFSKKDTEKNKITHLITYHHGLLPRSILASIFLGIKQIVSERNSLSHYKFIKLKKFNIGFISIFFADKITVQINSYKKQYPIFIRKKIITIPNTIKDPIKNREVKLPLNKTICMVGRLSEQKNFSPILYQTLYKKICLKILN